MSAAELALAVQKIAIYGTIAAALVGAVFGFLGNLVSTALTRGAEKKRQAFQLESEKRRQLLQLGFELGMKEYSASAEIIKSLPANSTNSLPPHQSFVYFNVRFMPVIDKPGRAPTRSSTTKGKEQSGKVPEEAREAITRAGLPLRAPFSGLSAAAIADRFRRLAIKLHRAGKLQARYSVHDLRHAFAVRLYLATHDVYQVEQALGHANVAVTETYLRSLGVA
jgi:hypothetical protein